MGTAAADLEARQLRILGRIADLELAAEQRRLGALSIDAAPTEDGEAGAGATEARLSSLLAARGVRDFVFRRVPADYYDRPLEERRGLLRADSVAQLCKSIVMVRAVPFPFPFGLFVEHLACLAVLGSIKLQFVTWKMLVVFGLLSF